MSVMGLDIGTTGVKACVFDRSGKMLSRAYEEYPLQFPQPGWIELDATRVVKAMKNVVKKAASEASEKPRAVCASAQGEACTPLDAQNNILGPSIVTFDPRTAEFVPFWESKLGRKAFFQNTGMPLHGMYSLPKIQWWKKNRPEVYAKTKRFLCYEELAAVLVFGQEPVIGTSLAGRMGVYDLKERGWSKKLLDIAGVDVSLLPRPKSAGEIAGEIPASICSELDLAPGAKWVVGGHDQALCALGCGIDSPGRASYVTGTVECMAPVFDTMRLDDAMEARNFCCYESALPGKYMSIVFNFTGGSLLKWMRDTFFDEWAGQASAAGMDVYDMMLNNIPSTPTNLFVLPHFTTTGTPHLDTQARGAIIGLQLGTKRPEILKAVLEGVTYEMALNAKLQRESGIEIGEYRAIGGGARSKVWMQIKADILGKTIVRMENDEAGCLGAAMLGLAAVKDYPSIGEAVKALAKPTARFEPDAKMHALYAERLELYARLYPALKEVSHGLGKLKNA